MGARRQSPGLCLRKLAEGGAPASQQTARSALSAAELTAAHFGGGGPLRETPAPGEDGERPRSRKELIEELIAKSKQEKVRRPRRGRGPPGALALSFPARLRAVFAFPVYLEKAFVLNRSILSFIGHVCCWWVAVALRLVGRSESVF